MSKPYTIVYGQDNKDHSSLSDIEKISPTPSSFSLSSQLSYLDEKNQHFHQQAKLDPMMDSQRFKQQAAQAQKDVQSKMDEAGKRVVEVSDRIQTAAKPYARKLRSFSDESPLLFTFLVIFAALSLIPISCFAGFVLTAAGFIVGTACVIICLSILGTILLGASILLPILMFTTFLSCVTLSFLVSLFLAHRLWINISTVSTSSLTQETKLDLPNLSKGVKAWLNETKNRVPFFASKHEIGVHWNSSVEGWVLDADAKTVDDNVKVKIKVDRDNNDRHVVQKEDEDDQSSSKTVGLGIDIASGGNVDDVNNSLNSQPRVKYEPEAAAATMGRAAGRDVLGSLGLTREVKPMVRVEGDKGADAIGVNWTPPASR